MIIFLAGIAVGFVVGGATVIAVLATLGNGFSEEP